jgi:FdhE protein
MEGPALRNSLSGRPFLHPDIYSIKDGRSSMADTLDQIKQQIARFKKEKPLYREILDLYALILEEQAKARPQLKIIVPEVNKKLARSRLDKGLPLLGKEGFAIDLEVAQRLFYTLSAICQGTTPKMGAEIPKIIEAAEQGALALRDLLSRHYDMVYLKEAAEHCEVDQGILSFLIRISVRPCLETQMEQLRGLVDPEAWLQGKCPLCGSPPQMAQLRDEGGKRYLQCSLCGCQWRWERIACPYCSNKVFDSLHYLSAEEEEAYRVDLCDQCKGYIKTIDSRKLDYEPFLDLEDILTIHLDILALEKGYRRSAQNPWGPITLA